MSQSWWRPECANYGPNNILYASLIINVFLIYGVGRKCVIEPLQEALFAGASEEVHPLTLQVPPLETFKILAHCTIPCPRPPSTPYQ